MTRGIDEYHAHALHGGPGDIHVATRKRIQHGRALRGVRIKVCAATHNGLRKGIASRVTRYF